MGIDTLFYVKTNEASFALGGKNIAYDQFIFPLALEIIKLLKKGCTDPDKIAKELDDFLIVCDKDWTEDEATVVIDMVNEKVDAPRIILERAEDFENEWGSIVKNEDGVFVDWGDNELEPVINAKEEIDRVYPLLDKNVRTFDELEKIVEFIKWCKEQDSTVFEYCDSLMYHFGQA